MHSEWRHHSHLTKSELHDYFQEYDLRLFKCMEECINEEEGENRTLCVC